MNMRISLPLPRADSPIGSQPQTAADTREKPSPKFDVAPQQYNRALDSFYHGLRPRARTRQSDENGKMDRIPVRSGQSSAPLTPRGYPAQRGRDRERKEAMKLLSWTGPSHQPPMFPESCKAI